jgi:hypothetical protein
MMTTTMATTMLKLTLKRGNGDDNNFNNDISSSPEGYVLYDMSLLSNQNGTS